MKGENRYVVFDGPISALARCKLYKKIAPPIAVLVVALCIGFSAHLSFSDYIIDARKSSSPAQTVQTAAHPAADRADHRLQRQDAEHRRRAVRKLDDRLRQRLRKNTQILQLLRNEILYRDDILRRPRRRVFALLKLLLTQPREHILRLIPAERRDFA